jgi:methylenetetrahydrofolate--tRNA-(uracil-5-)-methyltransferase
VFRTIPGLENAEFQRYGAVHRNTFINAPKLLGPTLELVGEPGLYFAGQISGTEGYVESAAGGLLVALFLLDRLAGREPQRPPSTTALGGLLTHTARNGDDYQPSNITFSHLPPWEGPRLKKRPKYEAMAARALADLDTWLAERAQKEPAERAG